MPLRVLGGELRGRTLFGGSGRAVRPTLAQVREAMFNILAGRVEGARVLDAFAGSGALGIEALSRGAAHVVCLERDAQAHRLLGRNLETLEITARIQLQRADCCQWMRTRAVAEFDLIFLDPPYAGPEGQAALRYLGEEAILHPGVLVTWEYASRSGPAAPRMGQLECLTDRKYGETGLAVYGRKVE